MPRRIFFDKTEIVLMVFDKGKMKVLNITYDKIVSIKLEGFMERILLRKVPSERIIINISGREKPVIYTKLTEKKYFDEYKSGIVKFASSNNITFYDNL